ncbi:MAG: EAL domain-containing protein [Alteromonadaceae bacterium]|nr:EAL domain-containing protein [Alteromonadaceae bacterium]
MPGDILKSYILNEGNTGSADERLKKLLSIMRRHLGMDVAFISEFVNEQRVFKLVDTAEAEGSIKAGDADPLSETYCEKIADSELDEVIRDTARHPVTRDLEVTRKLSIGSYMGVPIKLSDGEVFGTFCCYKAAPDETLNERDHSFLSAIAEIITQVIESDIVSQNTQREVNARIHSVLAEDSINIHYQPIYSLEADKVVGYESLSRFSSEPYRTPDIWFAEAASVGLGEDLEMMAIRKAVTGLNHFDPSTYISINASPEYVLNGAIHDALAGIDVTRIVLEITEHSPVNSYPDLVSALEPLRKRGMRLAIDDAGAGYASFQHVLELDADIIKLDRSLTREVDVQMNKHSLARALCAFATSVQCEIIAEGVETQSELKVLKELGVGKVQGYLIGRPAPIGDAVTGQA